MEDHLNNYRTITKDKDNIIANLTLRYDLEILPTDPSRNNNQIVKDEEIDIVELKKKAEALAQRTVLENFELRELVHELNDENFRLRNEIYEIKDKLNRSILKVSQLESELAKRDTRGKSNNVDDDEITSGDEEDNKNRQQIQGQARRKSKEAEPEAQSQTQNLQNGNIGNTIDPANTDEAQRIRAEREAKHTKQNSLPTVDIFSSGNDNQQQKTNEYANTEEAQRIREEKQKKHNAKQSSGVTPNLFEENINNNDNDELDDSKQGTKRRGSQDMDEDDDNENDPRNAPEAVAKRAAREQKNHRRDSSTAAPNKLFTENYDPEKEAKIQQQKNWT